MHISARIKNLGFYAFDEVGKAVEALKEKGIKPIDFGVGDPIDPTPELIREAGKKALDGRKTAGYPSYIGTKEFRQIIAEWTQKRFGVQLDPETEITSSIGSKEAIFHFPLAFIDPGDIVISPNPGYPPYERGTAFAGGENYFLPLLRENNFLMDFDSIPEEITRRAKIMWINYPSNPCGVMAPAEYFQKAIAFGRKHDIIIASDECYTELYFDREQKPHSILEFAEKDDKVVVFQSLSKRSNMTCYRVGWVAGNAEVIAAFRKIKTNVDSGTPTFVQDAAAIALTDEAHVAEQRNRYAEKREILRKTFALLGWEDCTPEAAFYVWQKIPAAFKNSVEFAKALLAPEIGIIVTPGEWISKTVDGVNPGERYVRFALVPHLEEIYEAMSKLKKAFGKS